jgi:hypothetical protein
MKVYGLQKTHTESKYFAQGKKIQILSKKPFLITVERQPNQHHVMSTSVFFIIFELCTLA